MAEPRNILRSHPPTHSPDIAELWHHRRKSISFNPQISLDNGKSALLEGPLPCTENTSRPRGRPPLGDVAPDTAADWRNRSRSATRTENYDPHTGEPRLSTSWRDRSRYRTGERRWPLLDATVDELARLHEDQRSDSTDPASLASSYFSITKSPSCDTIYSSNHPRAPDYFSSPASASSLFSAQSISHPSSPSTSRPGSFRSRRHNGERPASLRNGNRRGTKGSTPSSESPASAFLKQWGREEAAALTEPDDEGQEIGGPGASQYIIGKQIGFGGFSVIKEAYTIENGERITRAVKIVRKNVQGRSELENDRLQMDYEHEISIWRYLKHRYILPLYSVWNTDFATFCVTQLNKGGTLFDLVRANRKLAEDQRGLPSRLAKRYIYQLALALRYLHEDARVVHRDIKLENCLLDMDGPSAATEGGNILLCDFGMADFITHDQRQSPSPPASPDRRHSNIGPCETSTNFAGSLQYASPELISSSYPIYDPSVDIWAFGVVLYALLVGDLPFQHSFSPKLQMMILRGEWDEQALRHAHGVKDEEEEAVELIRGCLDMDTQSRWRVDEVLACRWLDGINGMFPDEDEPPFG